MLIITIMSLALMGSLSASAAITTNPYGSGAFDLAPAGTPIFTVANGAKSHNYMIKDLNKLHTSVISIYEPLLSIRQKFTGVSLLEIFTQNGILKTKMVRTQALNNYSYVKAAINITNNSGYLAIARKDHEIPYDQGAPIRINFPDRSKWSKNLGTWNWSIRKFVVK